MKKKRWGECKAKIKLDEAGNFLEQINNHTHAQSETKYEITKVRANIKEEQQRLNILLKLL